MPAWVRNEEERSQLLTALRSTPPPEPVRGRSRAFLKGISLETRE